MKNDIDFNVVWFGRCCFLVKLNKQRILFDPYDKFCNIDMGIVDAEILISSSSWHDHGHIGAAPGAWIFSYPGEYNHKGIKISGIEVKEERGSPMVIFNIFHKGISITNFADTGVYEKNIFSNDQKKILESTNIAFIGLGHEKVLELCNPKIIIPEHYFPRQFIDYWVPDDKRVDFENQNIEIEKMLQSTNYNVEEVNDYQCSIDLNKFDKVKVLKLLKVHPQVRYTTDTKINRYW